MKILTIIKSTHMGNTRKIAEAMAEAAPVAITDLDKIEEYNLHDYDIIGFGSGIYFGKHDKNLINFVEKLCVKKAYTFVFSTSGSGNFDKNNKALIQLLESKNKVVLSSFGSKAYDKYGPFKLIGGINKGHPNDKDFKAAQEFILNVIKSYDAITKNQIGGLYEN